MSTPTAYAFVNDNSELSGMRISQPTKDMPKGSKVMPNGSKVMPKASKAMPKGAKSMPKGAKAMPMPARVSTGLKSTMVNLSSASPVPSVSKKMYSVSNKVEEWLCSGSQLVKILLGVVLVSVLYYMIYHVNLLAVGERAIVNEVRSVASYAQGVEGDIVNYARGVTSPGVGNALTGGMYGLPGMTN